MKNFLLKVALFLILFATTFALPIVFETAVRSRVSLELPKGKTVLFVGDSHVARGVNEKFIPGAFNWANGGESFLNLFPRVRELLNVNQQVHTVFISVTPHNLERSADSRIYNGDGGALLERSIIFYGKEELEDCGEAMASALKNPGVQRKALWASIRSKTFGTLKEFGGFYDLGDSSKHFWKQIEGGGKLGKEKFSYARNDKCGNGLSLKYLRKIVELVRARGGKIIFLNPPIYHAEEFFDVPYFENLLKENFPDVEFWDYRDFPMPENCFYNVNHLNSTGAEIFSKELARRIEKEGIIDD